MARVLDAQFLEILLMVFLSPVEMVGREDRGHDGPYIIAAFVSFIFFSQGLGLLFGRVVENHATVLRARIRALSVDGGGVVILKKYVQQLLIANLLWIKRNAYRLGMAGLIGANIAVSGIGGTAALKSDLRR